MSARRVAILQSNYIPWKGYFDLINSVDAFYLLDGVQYTKSDWRNRNRIKTPAGTEWLSIPVFHTLDQKIEETRVSDPRWRARHWKTLTQHYGHAPFFSSYQERFRAIYLERDEELLSRINRELIAEICQCLAIATPIDWVRDLDLGLGKSERLVDLCLRAGAAEYLSGPSAKAYLDEKCFQKAGISVKWMDYSGYREYHQPFPPFEHAVSVLDLLFNEGPRAPLFMKSFPRP